MALFTAFRRRLPQLALAVCVGIMAGAVACPLPAAAIEPYVGYNYSYYWKPAIGPNAYLPEASIDGASLGAGAFKLPGDLFVAKNGLIYILDSGNGRIVVVDRNYRLVRQMSGFKNGAKDDRFSNPQGLFVTDDEHLYVADTDNKRIVELDGQGGFVREIGPPQSDILRSDFQYAPYKIALDRAKRIYVVGRGVFDGIMEFNPEGTFNSFIGAPRVTIDPVEYFWKSVSTKKQRDKMIQFVPTEFNNLNIDASGFIFATTQTKTADPIQRLNPTGQNILRKQEVIAPIGDILHDFDGGSMFSDISAGEHGMYSALDTKMGRIFTYDDEGHLLYIFGRLGQQVGTFRTPVAIDRLGDRMLVLDRDQASVTVFAPTPYGNIINTAVGLHDEGREDEARGYWERVLQYDANSELAYVGIGKALLRAGDYKEAMRNFKLGNDRTYYSKAFALERKRFTRTYFAPFMTTLIGVVLALWLGPKVWRKWRRQTVGGTAARGKGGVTHDGAGSA